MAGRCLAKKRFVQNRQRRRCAQVDEPSSYSNRLDRNRPGNSMVLLTAPIFCDRPVGCIHGLDIYWIIQGNIQAGLPMRLEYQRPRLGRFGLRSALLQVHRDLLSVHSRVMPSASFWPPALTNLEKLVLALEDRRFMRHSGVDLRSVVRELVKAFMLRPHGGASTVDMQFVRTATGYRSRKIGRKIYEQFLALLMQYRYSKITILRSYLACAFFGSHLIGSDSAAKAIYTTSAENLTLEQASLIAAMLVYPRPISPTALWERRVQRRAKYGIAVYIANKKRFDQIPG